MAIPIMTLKENVSLKKILLAIAVPTTNNAVNIAVNLPTPVTESGIPIIRRETNNITNPKNIAGVNR